MRVQEIKTSALKLVYEEGGPKNGKPVILVHGWPDSPRTWDAILPALHGAGYRTYAPYLRGFGPTEFRSPLLGRKPKRTGQPVALAQDIVDLADKLKLKTFDLVGHDWGARAAYAVAALFPQRLERMVTIAVPFVPGPPKPPAPALAQAGWYQFFFDTPMGQRSFRGDPFSFCKRMWDTWSPEGWYGPEQLAKTAESWANPDFVDVTLQYYRARWNPAAQDADFGVHQTRLESTPTLDVPTVLLQGLNDGVTLAETTDGAGRFFTKGYRRILMEGVGHFPQRENPQWTAEEIVRHLRGERMIVRHYQIEGRVQGVGFRWFVHGEAAELGLRGWVRNTDDGFVEAVAAGTPEQIEALEAHLRKGSRGSRVDRVRIHELVDSEADGLKEFQIEGAF